MAYTKIYVSNLDDSNNPTRSSDVVGITSNTEKNFNRNSTSTVNTPHDYLDRNGPDGDFKRIDGIAVLVNSIRNLLSTPRGSYPFDPEYGSNLYKLVFSIADSETEEEIKIETIDKIKLYDDRIRIKEVSTQFFSNKKGYRVNITIIKDQNEVSTSLDFTEDSAFILQEA